MKTSFDVLDELYVLLNVTAVTSLINGAVWRRKKPLDRRLQDITISSLDMRNDENVQPGIVIVNCFCENHPNGLPNETKLKRIGNAVIALLDDYHKAATMFFRTEIVNETIMQDPDDPAMSYLSIRVSIQIENT